MNLMRKELHLYTKKKVKHRRYVLLLPLLLCCSIFLTAVNAQPKYEFRGVWVATVENIDWPSQKYLSTDSRICTGEME
jgi:uncharacterized lipoprotein YddW (UPF0748 family)